MIFIKMFSLIQMKRSKMKTKTKTETLQPYIRILFAVKCTCL